MMSATSNWVQYDHTLGNGSSGYALRVEQSVDGSEDEARLFSPVLEPEMSGSCLSIWYHVNDGTGRHSGEASLNISSIKRTQSSSSPLNSSNSAQWTLALVDIPNVRVAFQVIIVAGLSHGFDGDIAIDDVDLVAANCSAVLAERFTLAVDNGLANNGSSGQWPSGQFAPDNATDDTWSPWLNSSASCENKCNQSSIALTGGQVGGPSLLVDTCSCSTLCKQETNCCPNYDQFCGSGPGSDDYRDHISSPMPDAGQSSGTPTVSPTQQFDTGDSSRTGSPLVEQTWTENAMSPTSPSSLPTPAIRIELSTSEPSSTKGSTTLTQIFPSNSTAGVHKLDTESDITGSASSSSIGKVRTERVDENQTHSSHDSSSFTPDTENSSGVRTTLAILTNISSGTTDAYITNSLDTSTSSSSSVSSQLAQNSTRQVSSVTSKQILDSSTDPSGDSKHVAENSTTTKSSVESRVAFSSTTTTVPTTVTTSRQTTMAASLDRSSTSRTSPRTTVQIEVNTEPVTSSINKQFKVPELDDEEDIDSKVKLPEGRSAGPSEQFAVKRDPNVRSEWNGQMVKEQAVMAAERKAADDHNQEANITGNGHVIWPLTILTVLMVSLLLGLFELRRRRRRTSTDSDIIGLLSLN
ncbi:MAM and LDL-receptor class A domain-containing protein 1 [Halotydeus destructor]|nr:MAM and LDL-receptor class A domain-containing protein 1 [Halotydeus destructor]